MPTDPHLHALFANAPTPDPIDVGAVVRKSRARRMPKVLGITAVSVLAVGGIVVGSIQGLSPRTDAAGSAPAAASAASSDMQTYDTIKRAPANRLNLCTGTVADVQPSQTGLVLTVAFPDAPAGTERVEGSVVMTNTGTQTLTGSTAVSPAITLAQGGIVLWHSSGVMAQPYTPVTLAPGESLTYSAAFEPVICSVDDDLADFFPDDLPAAAPGQYQVSAAIDFLSDADAELVTGAAQTITLN